MTTAFETGGVFTLIDESGSAFDSLFRKFSELDKVMRRSQAIMEKIVPAGFYGSLDKAGTALGELELKAARSADGIKTVFGGLGATLRPEFAGITEIAKVSFGELPGIARSASEGVVSAMTGATGVIEASMTSVRALMAETKGAVAQLDGLAAKTAPALAAASATGAGASLGQRRDAAHAVNNATHGGLHLRGPGMHVPGGGHIGMGGDGMIPLIGGLALGELAKKGLEHSFDFQHWVSQYQASGFSSEQIELAKRAAWNNSASNPNASATDSLKNILELNKATGSLEESMRILPAFSMAETAMQSVKAEGLHSKFNGGNQILNFARGLEELGVTQMGSSAEEREASIQKYTSELLRTMISSRGLFDGNALFAMTNNSGGAAQNWDMRMATTVAPIIGDVMKHGKLGNADYMALKGYQGGHITSDAAAALTKYGLATLGGADDPSADVYQDKKGFHLKANSHFAEGMDKNIWDWSGGVIAKLAANGVNTSDQHSMNAVVNEIGSNKSLSMLMRMVLEPLTRLQIGKEMDLRDKVPAGAAGILQNNDPVLKVDALHKKLDDFFTALGGPMTDAAIQGLTRLTSAIQAVSQVMEAHPGLTKTTGDMMVAGAAGLTLIGGAKMLGVGGSLLTGAAPAAAGGAGVEAAVAAGGAAGALGRFSPVLRGLALLGLADASVNNGQFAMKRSGFPGIVELADPGAADRLFGPVGVAMPALPAGPPLSGKAGQDLLQGLGMLPNLGGIPLGYAAPPTNFALGPMQAHSADAGDRAVDRAASIGSPSWWQKLFSSAGDGAQKMGQLTTSTGVVQASFDSLGKSTGGLPGSFAGLGSAAQAAAGRLNALAGMTITMPSVAGNSGVTQASFRGGPPPVVTAPLRKVTPGSSGGGHEHIEAAVHRALEGAHLQVAVAIDEKASTHIAKIVTRKQQEAMRFPTRTGGPNPRAHYVSPGTPVLDTA